MRKVLIVDDEKLIRKGIKTILEKSNLEFKNIKEASNGKEALDLLFSEQFDLLIIDIRLPLLDGISVIKKIQNMPQKPKVVVISGYDEFSYAKECLEYGAKGYILKPIDKSELLELLARIQQELEREENTYKLFKMQNILKSRMVEVELNNILLSNLTQTEIKKKLETLGIDSKIQVYTFYTFITKDREEDYSIVSEDLKNNLIKLFPDGAFNITLIDYERNILVISDTLIEPLRIYDLCRGVFQKDVYIGIYNEKQPLENLKVLHGRSKKTALYAFVASESIEYYSNVKNRENIACSKDESIHKLKELILAGKQKEALSCVENIFNHEFLKNCSIESIQDTATKLYREIIERFESQVPRKILDMSSYLLLKNILNFSSMKEYIEMLKNFVYEATSMIAALKGILTVKDEIEEAIRFINENYYKDINMAIVANHVSLNYYYFSTIFKERIGMNFLDYLNKVRIDKAKELLANTNLKIWEISEKVGYKNPKHFARIFKEITGLTPNEYRDVQKSLQK